MAAVNASSIAWLAAPPPQEWLWTSAPLAVAQVIASMIQLVEVQKFPKPRRTGMILAFQLMPAMPMPLLPTAAAIPAQAVPCASLPPASPGTAGGFGSAVTASYPVTMFAARSGWSTSVPSSQIAMMTLAEPVVVSHADWARMSAPDVPPVCPVLLRPH